ncbi:FAD-binding protein [soil metagenome]
MPSGGWPARESARPVLASPDPPAWDRETDVLVVGSGGAGYTTALFAQRLGHEALILEKADRIGGTTLKTGGWYWVPNNSLMRALGHEDSREDAIRYMARLSRPTLYDPEDARFGLPEDEHALIAAFYDHGAAAIDTLGEMGALASAIGADVPDYYAQIPENRQVYGRVLYPLKPDGEPARAGGGVEMVRQLDEAARARGIEVLTSHRVQRLVMDASGRVRGVEASDGEGRTVRVGARDGVVFASGGFVHDAELRRNFLSDPVFSGCGAYANEGDLVHIAGAAGATFRNMNYAWMCPLPFEWAVARRPDLSGVFTVPGDSMIFVNKLGRRTANEKAPYNELARAFFRWDAFRGEYPDYLMFMIYDDRCASLWAGNDYGNVIPPEGADDAHVVRGATLEELERALGERLARYGALTSGVRLEPGWAAAVARSVERFNGFARAGADLDFHRGASPIEPVFNGPGRGENVGDPTMFPISTEGPWHCVILVGGALDTKGGPKVDLGGRILDVDRQPIPGLYGAGNCVASPSGRAYWAGGGTLGPIFTFAYLTAEAIHVDSTG